MRIMSGSAAAGNILIKITASLLVMFSGSVLLIKLLLPKLVHTGHGDSPGVIPLLTINFSLTTAVSFVLCGCALWALLSRRYLWIKILALILVALNISSLMHTCCDYAYSLDSLLNRLLLPPPEAVSRTPPTIAVAFNLIGFALLALCFLRNHLQRYGHISAALFSFLVAVIATIAVIAQAFDPVVHAIPSGAGMSALAALGLLLMSLALLILFYSSAVAAFNRVGFFYRLAIAFGFMTVLFLSSGSIALIQISNISTIINDLYRNPLQIDKAAGDVAEEVGSLNRTLKDIAIDPELFQESGLFKESELAQTISSSQTRIAKYLVLIADRDNFSSVDVKQLELGIARWHQLIGDAYQQLQENDIDAYRALLLNDGQQTTIELEQAIARISQQARQDIRTLGDAVIQSESNAKRILILSSLGFLVFGLIVALLITRSVTRQLYLLRRAMIDVANKKTDTVIPGLNDDNEMGEMARTLAVFAQAMNKQLRMESRMRQIIEAAPNGIVMINDQGTIEIVNKQAENIFNYDRSQLLGEKIEMLVPTRTAAEHPDLRNAFFTDPSTRVMGAGRELFGRRCDGSEVPVEIGLAPIETEDGLKVLASIVDISERKKSAQRLLEHQSALEKANRHLAKINKELETFAYVASHDLKSPLRGIVQLSSWIEDDLLAQDYAELPNHMRLMKSRIQRMEKLLDDLLLFNRAGRNNGKLTQVNVSEMATEVFNSQNIRPGIRLELTGELPTFTTFSTPFEQVLRNLFSNALKHHDREMGVVTLTCSDVSSEFYEFSVSDDGPGIPEQYQQRVFAMFQTLKTRDEVEGSGMGLALIQKIVEAYGGTITLTSEGRGTCFTFSWPKQIAGAQNHG